MYNDVHKSVCHMTEVFIGPRAWNLPAAGITGSCELLDVGSARYPQILCKSSEHSELPSPACLSLATPLFTPQPSDVHLIRKAPHLSHFIP